jgi:HD-like signal output (HDOD) protein
VEALARTPAAEAADAPAQHTPRSIAMGITELVTLPAVYLEVRRIVNDPESGIVDLAQAVASDPAIAARLLRVANSPAYRTFRSVGTISQAVNVLGMQRVHELALASALASVFEGLPIVDANMAAFWSRAVTTGAIARSLGSRCPPQDLERLFVEGLLCEVGHLAMFQCAPDCVNAVLAQGSLTAPDVAQREREVLGFHHAEVGAALLDAWELPPPIVRTVSAHCAPLDAPDPSDQEPLLCCLAWHVACSLAGDEEPWERVQEVAAELPVRLALDEGTFLECVEQGIEDAVELQELFFPGLAGGA